MYYISAYQFFVELYVLSCDGRLLEGPAVHGVLGVFTHIEDAKESAGLNWRAHARTHLEFCQWFRYIIEVHHPKSRPLTAKEADDAGPVRKWQCYPVNRTGWEEFS